MSTNKDWEIKRKKHPARLARAKAIKLYCKEECCAGDLVSWKNCPIGNCFLWNFRLGREVLGNQTSFKKHRENKSFFKKKEPLQEVSEPVFVEVKEMKEEEKNTTN